MLRLREMTVWRIFNLTSKSKEVVMLTKEVLELSEEQLEQFKNCGTKKKILCQLKEALREVDLGTYGRCQICQKQIDTSDLSEYPHTTTCHACGFEYDRFPWVQPDQ